MSAILIVEDDPRLQECYYELLTGEGYEVISAYTGEQGLQKIQEHRPCLLILDLAIPGINGRDLLREIKKINKTLPIVIASGKIGMQNDPEIKLCNQVRAFLTKPVKLRDMVMTIDKLLAQPIALDETQSNRPARISRLGMRLSGCLLQESIGKGNNGVVYKAIRMENTVAVKILSGRDLSEEKIARFQREAQMLARVAHPNIIELLDTGYTKEGDYFIVMQYFEGESLDRTLRNQNVFNIAEAIHIINMVAQGIAAAHSVEVIHRDIKPSNILYNQSKKTLKIVDFGLAKAVQVEQQLTQDGEVLGTPFYMSPEQCRGLNLDRRSDIYSLGATLYHLITGAPPYNTGGAFQTMIAHINTPLTWSAHSMVSIPLELRCIIEIMMAKLPEERYQNMEEFIHDIEQFQAKLDAPTETH